jgi:hypothetical protein
MALQMAFKAINDTMGPKGVIPTLLVYGAYPRITENDPPSPTVLQRAAAVKKATAEIRKLRAEKQVQDALNTRNGPNTTDVHDLPLDSDIMVWREPGQWEGPYKLVSIDRETCVLALPHGNTPFRSTSVKPWFANEDSNVDAEEPSNGDNLESAEPAEEPVRRKRGRPRKVLTVNFEAFLQSDEDQFAESRHSEILGLIEKGVFKIVRNSDVPEGTRTFNSRFVDEVKFKNDVPFMKSRLVVQAYGDEEKSQVLTQSPTIQQIS